MTRKYFRKYTIELVKEDEGKYEGVINSSEDAYNKILEVFRLNRKAEEHFVMFCLDTKNQIIGAFLIAKGGVDLVNINVVDIIKRVLLCNSKKIIIAHNHPSGNYEISECDYKFTDKLNNVCRIMNIILLDHLIIGDNGFKSIIKDIYC